MPFVECIHVLKQIAVGFTHGIQFSVWILLSKPVNIYYCNCYTLVTTDNFSVYLHKGYSNAKLYSLSKWTILMQISHSVES